MHALAILAAAWFIQPPAKTIELPDSPTFKEAGAEIKPIGKNVWVDFGAKSRRVIVRGAVCRNDVELEEFMCLKGTKEHESIVTADVVPKVFHAALISAGADSGTPARFDGKFHPPTGDKLKITVEWKSAKETKRATAQDWIRDANSKKAITHDFVFAGSQWVKSPITGEDVYLGDEGDLISVANFSSSIIDLAIQSTSQNDQLQFTSFKDRIPPIDTEVFVIISVAQKAAKRDAKKSN